MLAPRFRVPLVIGCVMLLLGFIGVILTDILKDGAWMYWLFVVFFYAAFSLGFNLYSRGQGRTTLYTFGHEIWHWIGVFLCLLLIFFMVKIGILSRFLASLQLLTLLGLSTYLIGVYFNRIFIPIGIALGLFAASIAFFDQYLYLIVIPLIAIVIGIIMWIVQSSNKNSSAME
jgi:hypothetical protein